MKTERIKRRLYRIEKAAKQALNVATITYLVLMPDGSEREIPPEMLETLEGATLRDVIIHVPDNIGAERGKKWH